MHGPDDQLLEYTQYIAESLHSLDHGKHLGDRISTHMLEATTPVPDLPAERAYDTAKLAFKSAGTDGNEMYVARHSGDKVELRAASPDAKPHVLFIVANVRHASKELRKWGFEVQKSRHAVSVTDPDGAVIVFVAPSRASGS